LIHLSRRTLTDVDTARGEAPERIVGKLYMLNTAGGIIGSLAAGFWLLPYLGTWKLWLVLGS
jgi:spermidine synthase